MNLLKRQNSFVMFENNAVTILKYFVFPVFINFEVQMVKLIVNLTLSRS